MQFDLSIAPVRTWNPAECVVFCRVRHPWGELSNMRNGYGYDDQGQFWGSTEAQYQAGAFPHDPAHQEKIRLAPNAMSAKIVAYEKKDDRRSDWQAVKLPMMAYALTRKHGVLDFADILARTQGRPIVELSTRDDFWGAKPRGNVLVGRNMLGILERQLADGARLDELPEGTYFGRPPEKAPAAQASFFGMMSREGRGLRR